MKTIMWWVALLAACGGSKSSSPAASARVAVAAVSSPTNLACTDPADYGALPDDGVDDQPGIQQAIDDHPGCVHVCLRQGLYELHRVGGTGPRRGSSISIERPCVAVTGQDQATDVRMVGDGEAADWAEFRISPVTGAGGSTGPVTDVLLSNMLLDGSGATHTDEQTHLVMLGGGASWANYPVERTVLRNLWFYHPQRPKPDGGVELGGDCVRLLGNFNPANGVDQRVSKTQILANIFHYCNRSSISVQRAAGDTLVGNNTFLGVAGQHIDAEPSGSGPITTFVISNNTFSGGEQGETDVAWVGQNDPDLAFDLVMTGNQLRRGLQTYNVRRAVIADNDIAAVMTDAQAVVSLEKVGDEILLGHNLIRRQAGSATGAVVKLLNVGTGTPARAILDGNVVDQEVSGNVIDLTTAQDVSVTGNQVTYTGPPATSANPYAAVYARATTQDVAHLLIAQNRAIGPLWWTVRLQPSPFAINQASVLGNSSSGIQGGLRCDGAAALYLKPVVHAGYNYLSAASAVGGLCPVASQQP